MYTRIMYFSRPNRSMYVNSFHLSEREKYSEGCFVCQLFFFFKFSQKIKN